MIGLHVAQVTLAVGATVVPGSPFRILCQQPRVSELESTLDRRGGHGFLGEQYTAVRALQ
jgi:hypothetical protein